MKVLVIPENRELDQYILKPVVEKSLKSLCDEIARLQADIATWLESQP